ncbi:uncharacterized protein BO97DRAFT_446930 [Aspergillus homomorphus CBS 101889]|uniref:Uncharacterized protein n=1 Tax=Aspergillus homomorphus (strain CBS 101889) TaxID=1450537 RepID=A0A395HHV8_ASPHC|nr:hypothetical protein BO97DRAFT_446930 [Aspergillus homomorphus CBS 101889]RAL07330.1 hypothetical protein BO97DRAFT_446930 [Aspergillus homomorphus CBS 101889]
MPWSQAITREGFSSDPAGKRAVENSDFVRGQFQHYGVTFDERQFSGWRMQNTVPPRILELKAQLHREWLNACTPEQLDPELIIEKYFGSKRQPDCTITTTVVGIPFPPSSQFRAGQMRDAASKVVGLHQETGSGPSTQMVFMGWDKDAVGRAAKGHAAKEKQELRAAEEKREYERAQLHANYCRQARKVVSPVGSYIVDSAEIEREWPDLAKDLCLDIHETEKPGTFEAEFDFGVLEGVMIVCADQAALEQYSSRADRAYEKYWADEEKVDDNDYENISDLDDADEDKRPRAGSKRKAPAPQHRGGSKKHKAASVLAYRLKMRSCETGESEINYHSENGTIEFKDGRYASFVAKANMWFVGRGVKFTARKVSDTPSSRGKEWASYSERQSETERVNRWH